jgi:hypothetical protein
VATGSIEEAFNIGKDIAVGFISHCKLPVMDKLGLTRLEEGRSVEPVWAGAATCWLAAVVLPAARDYYGFGG